MLYIIMCCVELVKTLKEYNLKCDKWKQTGSDKAMEEGAVKSAKMRQRLQMWKEVEPNVEGGRAKCGRR